MLANKAGKLQIEHGLKQNFALELAVKVSETIEVATSTGVQDCLKGWTARSSYHDKDRMSF